jgi:hypothetical protein
MHTDSLDVGRAGEDSWIRIDVPEKGDGLSPSMEAEVLYEGERLFINVQRSLQCRSAQMNLAYPRDHLSPSAFSTE